ncbi:MAG: hypothetical protein WBE80_07915 [Methylocella sp.]
MDAIVAGMDVSKDKLDIAVLPQGQTFATSRDAKGLEGLGARLKPLALEKPFAGLARACSANQIDGISWAVC